MEKLDELAIDELTVDELKLVSGGKGQKIHMDYHNMNNLNDPKAVRIA